jgi:uncharacterized membrane protein YccC
MHKNHRVPPHFAVQRGMPTRDELIFALKTFAGAMTALYIAFWLGLENPYWSMATAYIVAQPLTGAMRSKALYRFIGTFIGGTAAVVLVPNLVNAPVLLSLAMGGWIGLCLYLSLLDRTPRAYLFMLAGYTAGIIGFPSVANPADIFNTALTRVEEISIGIACTTLFGTILLPRAIGPVLARRIVGWVKPGTDWAQQALAGLPETAQTKADRRKYAAEAADIALMTSQLAYDTSHMQSATRYIARLRLYVLSLMPVLSAIGDRVVQLRACGGMTPRLQTVLDNSAAWMAAGVADGAEALRHEIAALAHEQDQELSWPAIVRSTLLLRMDEMVSIAAHARLIRRHVLHGDAAPASTPDSALVAAPDQVRDHMLALLSALAVFIAVQLVCAFWVLTGWTGGAGAAVIVAVACSFFAAQDDPAPAILLMLRNALIATAVDALYIFLVFPRVEGFAELALVLLPAGLVVGVLVSRPATFGTGMVMGAIGSTTLGLENGFTGDFPSYVNGALALIFGLAAALVTTRLIRSFGAAFSARRLLRAGWKDIAAAASIQGVHDRAHLTGIMLDRLGLLAPRLAAVSPGADLAAADVLQDLRVGLNVIGLQQQLDHLPPAIRPPTSAVLAGIAAHYRGNPLAAAPPALLAQLDAAIRAAACHATRQREALMLLVGVRSVLFAGAPAPSVEAWA